MNSDTLPTMRAADIEESGIAETVKLQEFTYQDLVLKAEVSLKISPRYVIFRVGKRDIFINRDTGEWDGTGMDLR